jgi:hypothetical protein
LKAARRQKKEIGKQKRPGNLRAVAKSRPTVYQLPAGEKGLTPPATLPPPETWRKAVGLISTNAGREADEVASPFKPNKDLIKGMRLSSIMCILLRRLNNGMC